MQSCDVAVIGGGASGFMAAITVAEKNKGARVLLFEKSSHVLAKVKVSGGGRCNVTNAEPNVKVFSKNYPRGQKFVQKLFDTFGPKQTIEWFENRGLKLKIEPDGRMFPFSNKSQSVIDVLLETCQNLKIGIEVSKGLRNIDYSGEYSVLHFLDGSSIQARKVIIATGGGPKLDSYQFLENLSLSIIPPVPSLFTFNVLNSDITQLSGLSVTKAKVKIVGEAMESEGPLLITHWGFSGPAILKLSAWAARLLHDKSYHFKILINFTGGIKPKLLEDSMLDFAKAHPKKKVVGNALYEVPARLWEWLCAKSDIESDLIWLDISHKKRNRLLENLQNCLFEIDGKSTFKEEFVTCGGVSLDEVDHNLESLKYPGLYFCGELLDIDAITGGFNFQAAWTTGYVAGNAITL